MVRAETVEQLEDVQTKVTRCFEAGALATGATLELGQDHAPYSEMRHDHDLSALYQRNAEALGRSFADRSDRGAGSTDMGNVSLALPSIHPTIGIDSLPGGQPPARVHRQVRHPGGRPGGGRRRRGHGLDGDRRRRRPDPARAAAGRSRITA